ncbi:hypothetical protein [Halorientalis halophila]|uniref:hypothetical protein n=1 Tax=Halorientalis halophila TaxID=3108499 RepID=UPI00300B86FD
MGDDPTLDSEAELQAELTDLFRRAHEEGVDVLGGWECSNGSEDPHWDVIVTEVQRSDED